MIHIASRSRIALLASGLVVAASDASFAQAPVPLREGNIWNGIDHEPQSAQVAREERDAGIAAPAEQQRANAHEVDRLYQYLMRGAPPQAE
jgi:hypothetical protein